MTGDM